MEHSSSRCLATCACSALLALFLSACGGEGADTNASGPRPFSGTPSPNGAQPNNTGNPSNPGGSTENPANFGGTGSPGGATNPETQQGEIPLTPGMTGSPTQPGMQPGPTDPGMQPGPTDPGMQPGPTDPGTTPPGVDPGTQPPAGQPDFPPTALVRPTRGTRNVFTELLGVPEDQVNGKVVQAVNRFFGIGTNESTTPVRGTGFRVFYELPQDRSMAFIWTADADDIRSEGMSYGMMIALQMDMQTEFDQLWKFARTFMQFPGNSGTTSWRYNFRWQGTVNTSNANNWQVNFPANTGPAPDGDEYFAAALYLADRRWGSGSSGVNYQQEADNIANAMLNNPAANGNTPLINAANNLVVFYPSGNSAQFSDP
ncbi:MAG: putative bifunctional xylanase/esterase, partial [Pseudomonadota bacterium]